MVTSLPPLAGPGVDAMSGRERYSTPRELRSEADNLRAEAVLIEGIGNMVRHIAAQAKATKVVDGQGYEDQELTQDLRDAGAHLEDVVDEEINMIVLRLLDRAERKDSSAALQEPAVS